MLILNKLWKPLSQIKLSPKIKIVKFGKIVAIFLLA